MGKHKHSIISKDIESLTGFCVNCGKVKIKFKNNVWKCQISVNEHSGKRVSNNTKGPHGLTQKEAKDMRSGKYCEICGVCEDLVVDHCHSKKVIRGVLCRSCNAGLGMFKDSLFLLENAKSYLQKEKP